MVAYKTINTMRNKPFHVNSDKGYKMHQVGIKKTEIVNTTPEYEIQISAFNDGTDILPYELE